MVRMCVLAPACRIWIFAAAWRSWRNNEYRARAILVDSVRDESMRFPRALSRICTRTGKREMSDLPTTEE